MRKGIFSKDNIGQEVNCLVNGNGTIIDFGCGYSSQYTVKVNFSRLGTVYYDKWGKRDWINKYPTLSFNHKEDYVFDYGKPEFKYVPFVIGDKSAWCWVGDTIEDVEDRVAKRKVIASNGKSYLTISRGDDCNESVGTTHWQCAMECTPEEVLASKT